MVWLQGIKWSKKNGRMSDSTRLAGRRTEIFETTFVANARDSRAAVRIVSCIGKSTAEKRGSVGGLSLSSLTSIL